MSVILWNLQSYQCTVYCGYKCMLWWLDGEITCYTSTKYSFNRLSALPFV